MPVYHVERSITIEQPLNRVKDVLKDFKQWPHWSPWLVMEPDATLIYSDRQGQVGATYGWSGILVGAGSMELTEVHDDNLKMEIMFVKPFKSTAKVGFYFEESESHTKVTWFMDGQLPFFMFWMKYKMQAYIGMDYERGLLMLKEYLERGSVASYVQIEGILPMREQKYVGIPRICAMKDLGEMMKKDFEALYRFSKENNIAISGVPFTIYDTFDLLKKESSYVACIPVDEEASIQSSWIRGSVNGGKALKTRHKGRYLHLGNGWMTAMSFARMKKIKTMQRPLGYEYYQNDPANTPEEELITEIYLPLK